jgi:hypothetical protein
MRFADRAELAQELTANLKHGRAFVKDADAVEVLSDCVLTLVHPDDGAELALQAQVVMVCDSGGLRGVGLQLRPFDTAVVERVEAFVQGAREESPSVGEAEPDDAPEEESAAEKSREREDEGESEGQGQGGGEAAHEADELDLGDEDDSQPSDQQRQPARHERLRKLSVTEQQKVARSGDLNDRVMLERIYGKHVWEGLLHNPKLTLPEVARIARKGTVPRPLLEHVVDNNAWIKAPIVRRALLGNPRVSYEAIMKLLRITPKHELRTIYKTNTYSAQVRECARKVLDL